MEKLRTGRHRSLSEIEAGAERSRPHVHQRGAEIQPFGRIAKLPIALDEEVCAVSVANLNQLLADAMTLRDLYKKHHWQIAGPTFYQLHLLFDKHHDEQAELGDAIAERIQLLGGGREEGRVQLSRILEAHEIILRETRTMAQQGADAEDDGTNDLLVSQVMRTNELQTWFVAEHLVDAPLTTADNGQPAHL
jgi:starvation-inducible DNA-binding protein